MSGEHRTQNVQYKTKKPNYLTTLCINLSSTTCRMDLADILCTYRSSICNFSIQFCKSWRPKNIIYILQHIVINFTTVSQECTLPE